jgi:hypothetical protein
MENITDREFFEKLRDKADFRQNLRGNLVFRLKKLRGKSVFPEVEGKSCLSTKKHLTSRITYETKRKPLNKGD